MIIYTSYPDADSSNLLANTDLQTAPGPGIMKFYCVYTQTDALWTILVPNQPVVLRNRPGNYKTTANVDLSADIPFMVRVNGGEQIVVALDEVTAGSGAFVAIFIPQSEM